MIALATGVWISRLVELLISPVASVIVFSIGFFFVARAERRLKSFAVLVFVISFCLSVPDLEFSGPAGASCN